MSPSPCAALGAGMSGTNEPQYVDVQGGQCQKTDDIRKVEKYGSAEVEAPSIDLTGDSQDSVIFLAQINAERCVGEDDTRVVQSELYFTTQFRGWSPDFEQSRSKPRNSSRL